MKSIVLILSIFALSTLSFAADRNCSNGNGQLKRELPGGFAAEIAPAADQAHAGQCHAAIMAVDQKLIAEAYGYETELNNISGADVNGDGKPDAILETHPASGQCCWNYYIVSLGDTPGLVRQITTSVPMNFEDKLGDGKVEIWGRDNAFDGVDNYGHAESPNPLVFFRLKGTNIYNVSNLFWSEYEREITQARSQISRSEADDLVKVETSDKKPQPGDPKDEVMRRTRALVLEIALDYLYGGKGQEAWKTISDMWPMLDRQRIRQVILQRRMHGVLGEINRQTKSASEPVAATQPTTPDAI